MKDELMSVFVRYIVKRKYIEDNIEKEKIVYAGNDYDSIKTLFDKSIERLAHKIKHTNDYKLNETYILFDLEKQCKLNEVSYTDFI